MRTFYQETSRARVKLFVRFFSFVRKYPRSTYRFYALVVTVFSLSLTQVFMGEHGPTVVQTQQRLLEGRGEGVQEIFVRKQSSPRRRVGHLLDERAPRPQRGAASVLPHSDQTTTRAAIPVEDELQRGHGLRRRVDRH